MCCCSVGREAEEQSPHTPSSLPTGEEPEEGEGEPFNYLTEQGRGKTL